MGIDLFDCVVPTRHGRNGSVFTRDGLINIRNAAYTEDFRPFETDCRCTACTGFTRAYARHLVLANEMVGARLCTPHNLSFYLDLLAKSRHAIEMGTFESFRRDFLKRFPRSPETPPKAKTETP